jgi:hypothetical protein
MSDCTIIANESARIAKGIEARKDTDLQPDEVVILLRARGKSVRCDSGYIWVTVENDKEDYVLARNDKFKIPRNGKVVVSGRGSFELD